MIPQFPLLTWSLLICLGITVSCTPNSDKSYQAGKALSEQYCQSCHEYTEPSLLDKKTWRKYVLPRMGYMLGLGISDSIRESLYEPGPGGDIVKAAGIFPQKAVLSPEEWEQIQEYFLSEAPEALEDPKLDSLYMGMPGFRTLVPDIEMRPPSTTLLHIPATGGLYLGDANSKRMLQFDMELQLLGMANLKEGLVSLHEEPDFMYLTLMGSFSPTDAKSGMLMALSKNKQQGPQIILPALQRPVHSSFGDLNEDGRTDILVSEFGKWTGKLSWWENQGQKGVKAHTLKAQPGASKTHILDVNQDGLQDILVLFAQGDEGVSLFKNQSKGTFLEEKLISFPASYGMSNMEVIDWNGDGHLDLMLTSGDNADYPPLIKPYHGIYLYLNDGNFQFEQSWFYAFPGAYATRSRDFDQDGDLDIAAISFFPDYAQNPRSFVLLLNQGNSKFSSYSFPEAAELGRWLVMDAGDIDQDGDEDIVLGSLAFEVPGGEKWLRGWVNSGLPFVVLENTFKQK